MTRWAAGQAERLCRAARQPPRAGRRGGLPGGAGPSTAPGLGPSARSSAFTGPRCPPERGHGHASCSCEDAAGNVGEKPAPVVECEPLRWGPADERPRVGTWRMRASSCKLEAGRCVRASRGRALQREDGDVLNAQGCAGCTLGSPGSGATARRGDTRAESGKLSRG